MSDDTLPPAAMTDLRSKIPTLAANMATGAVRLLAEEVERLTAERDRLRSALEMAHEYIKADLRALSPVEAVRFQRMRDVLLANVGTLLGLAPGEPPS